jgi:glycyl-tRNA synthetase
MDKAVNLVTRYRRKEVENLMKRKFFVVNSFEIYGGIAGLFDYGPLGCALKNNVETLWRNHFVLEEDMLEVACTCLTPYAVLETSGHVAKFEDFMVKDLKNGQCHRADKLLEDHVDKVLAKKAGKMKEDEENRLKTYKVKADTYNQEELTVIF